MNYTNVTNLPQPIFKALTHSDYTRGHSNRSVTQLIDSPRVRILRKEHDDDITEDVSDMVWSVLGTSVHKMFEEHHADGHTVEERLYADIDGWTISGAIDLQRSEDDGTVTILDYKCTSVWSVIYGKKEWDKQLNCYAWLAEQAGREVGGLQIVAVLRDWQRSKAKQDPNYPAAPMMVVPIPLWSQEERNAYVKERVALHQHAEYERLTGGHIPHCTDEERWKKDESFAVKKKGNKRALRVFNSTEEAEQFMADQQGLELEHRVGRCIRCDDNWCRVADWCEQYENEAWS